MKIIQILTSILLISITSCEQKLDVDYFGLDKPSNEVFDFDPEILNLDGTFVFNAIYNVPICDEFYYTLINTKEDIYFSKKINGEWSRPKIADFSDPLYHDADPFFANDGTRVYFVSSRPINEADTTDDYNIWYADKKVNGWNDPIVLPEPINSIHQEYFFSISDKGNAFFSSNRPGGHGSFDIYKTSINEGVMSDPVNIGPPINTEYYEFDPYISLDESFMIFATEDRPENLGRNDIFFSYKKDGKWSEPIHLPSKINTEDSDFGSALSPDNKYLIFTNGGKFKWISVDYLETLK